MILLLVKIREIICIEKFNNTKFSIDTVDEPPGDVSLKSSSKMYVLLKMMTKRIYNYF